LGEEKASKSKSKAHGLRSMGLLFLHDASQKENPTHFKDVDGVRLFESH
jgi:hypothetical protein